MFTTNLYAVLSVIVVSLISLVGVFALSLHNRFGSRTLRFMVSFAVGALLGDVFIHLLPELVSENKFNMSTSLIILVSVLVFFVTESFIHWHHHHSESAENELVHHPVVFLNLVGDGLHNFIDGLVIGAAYLINTEVGLATTLAVILHEIPQEIGDFGVLIYGGLTKGKALFYNFLSALTSLLGVIIALVVGPSENFSTVLIAIGIGSFIYISLVDLVPEIHKSRSMVVSQFLTILSGIGVMLLLLLLG